MAYQTFGDEKGDSNSSEKLKRVRLPADLTGKSLLDIGCNEGFFCGAALARGASRVVGIDNNPAILAKAKARFPKAEFLNCTWWDAPAERFDYILFLSAIHYEPEQRRLLNFLISRLKPDGILILECGAFYDLGTKEWRPAQRHDGVLRYPTFRLLMEDLLADYAVRDMGPSIEQSGDPVPRWIFHCRRAKPTLFLVGGASGAGKTVFTRQFARAGLSVLYTDPMLNTFRHNTFKLKSDFVTYTEKHLDPARIDLFIGKIIEDQKVEAYCKAMLTFVTHNEPLTIMEGYAFSFPEFQETMKRLARAQGYKVVLTVV